MCIFLYYHTQDDIFHLTSFFDNLIIVFHAYYYIRSVYFLLHFDQYIEVQIFMQNISWFIYNHLYLFLDSFIEYHFLIIIICSYQSKWVQTLTKIHFREYFFISFSQHIIICHLQTWLTLLFSNIFIYVVFLKFIFVLAIFVRTDKKAENPNFHQWRCLVHTYNNKELCTHLCYLVIQILSDTRTC